jgi:hypothetical protein
MAQPALSDYSTAPIRESRRVPRRGRALRRGLEPKLEPTQGKENA